MYNKTIVLFYYTLNLIIHCILLYIEFGFCDIQNNRGLGKGYQPQPSASADNPYLDLNYSGYHENLIQ